VVRKCQFPVHLHSCIALRRGCHISDSTAQKNVTGTNGSNAVRHLNSNIKHQAFGTLFVRHVLFHSHSSNYSSTVKTLCHKCLSCLVICCLRINLTRIAMILFPPLLAMLILLERLICQESLINFKITDTAIS